MHFYLHIIWFLDTPTLGVPSFDLSCGPRVKPCWIFWWNSSVGFKRVQNHHYWNAAPGKPGGYSPCNTWRRNCAGRIRRQLAAHHHTSPIFSACTDERNLRLGGGKATKEVKVPGPTHKSTHIFSEMFNLRMLCAVLITCFASKRKQKMKWGTHGNGRSIQCLKDQLGPKISLVECRYQKVTAGGGPLWISNSGVYHVNPWKMLSFGISLRILARNSQNKRPISFFRCFKLFALFITDIHSVLQDATAHDGWRPFPLAGLSDSELISLRAAVHGGRLVLQPWPCCSGYTHHQCARSLHLGLPPQLDMRVGCQAWGPP